eukprot:TRINITY_DN8558_c0_g1_i1.p1 TRINITY_DN8558_c0_g1~~TRINITY_DN8558_c0_g1_i1.p1  ORF type:complete len:528 (+),score=86.28 TRINITY_DN8558_c0_g1_i1:336-1919(+)
MATNLRVVTAQRPPFVFQNTFGDGTGVPFYGMLVDLLPLLFQYANMNVTLEYYYTPFDAGGVLLPNGTWNGVIGELVAGRADIAAFPLSLAPGRPDAIDMTYSYYEAGLGMIVKKESGTFDGVTVFLKPFTTKLWLSLIATVVFITLSLHLLAWVSPYGRYEVKKVRNVTSNAPIEEFVIHSENSSYLLDSLMATVVNPPIPASKSWAVRLPSIAFYLFMVVVVASFTANLASLLTVESFSSLVSNLADLRQKALPFVVNTGGATYTYFTKSMDPAILMMQAKMQTAVGNTAALKMVRSGQVVAYLTDLPTLLYFGGEPPCDLQVVGPEFGPGVYTFGLQKNSNLTHVLNTAMLQLGLNGVLDGLHKKWIDDLDVCSSNGVSNKSLSVQEFAGMWYLLLGVVAFGFLWALGERFLVYLLARFPQLRGEVKRANEALAVHGKRFKLSRRFSMRPSAAPNLDGQSKAFEGPSELGHGFSDVSRHHGSTSPIDRAIRKVDEESPSDLGVLEDGDQNSSLKTVVLDFVPRA